MINSVKTEFSGVNRRGLSDTEISIVRHPTLTRNAYCQSSIPSGAASGTQTGASGLRRMIMSPFGRTSGAA